MTYLSVIAAASAAALVASSVHAGVATGEAAGKRIDKPATVDRKPTATAGAVTSRRQLNPVKLSKTIDKASPK